MSDPQVAALLAELAADLELLMKTDDKDDLRNNRFPILFQCVDSYGPMDQSFDEGLAPLISAALANMPSSDEQTAIGQLFVGPNRWTPLGERGAAAAGTLGITYDALRRRNRQGQRRFDALLEILAHSILSIVATDDVILPSDRSRAVPGPDADIFSRASIFFSYSRDDDQHEGNLVTALRDQLTSEFRFQTGHELFVFHDKSSVALGEDWRRAIERGIDATNFLLVLLTPSYLRSDACRVELERFLERERQLQRDDLILPIYYATVPVAPNDDLSKTLLSRQYVDWRDLRFQDPESSSVRRAVAALASSISGALARTADIYPLQSNVDSRNVGEPALIERMSDMEIAMARLLRSLMTLADEQNEVSDEVRQSTAQINRASSLGRGASARLLVARRLSSTLEPSADRMERLASTVRLDLDTIDAGIKAIAGEVPSSIEPSIEEVTEDLIRILTTAVQAGDGAVESVEAMGESYESVGKASSTMRPVLGRLLSSANVMVRCRDKYAEWVTDLEKALEARRTLMDGSAKPRH